MPTHDERIAALEKDAATMKRDISYKLDDTNSAVTIIKGVMGALAQDVKIIKSQMKTMDLRLDGIDTRLARVEERQDEQGQGIREIRHSLDTFEQSVNNRFNAQDEKLDAIQGQFSQILQMLTTLTTKADE